MKIILALPFLFLGTSTVSIPVIPQVEEVRLIKELVPICACESTGDRNGAPTQFNEDGTVKKGKENPLDTGMCQVNLYYHEEDAKKLGFDLFTEKGNIRYSNYLYKREGVTPWKHSKWCWDV